MKRIFLTGLIAILNLLAPTSVLSQNPPSLVAASCIVSPSTVAPLGRLTVTYGINNPNSSSMLIGLGCSIRKNGTSSWRSDANDDVYVTVPAGYSTQKRYFDDIPLGSSGSYDVAWGLWQTFGIGSPWDLLNKPNQFTVNSPPDAPGTPYMNHSSGNDTGQNQYDGVTNNGKPVFSWQAATDPDGNPILGYYVSYTHSTPDSGDYWVTTTSWGPGWLDPEIPEGNHILYVRAKDSYGALGSVASYSFQILKTPLPPPSLVSPSEWQVTELTPSLKWNSVPGAWKYQVYVREDRLIPLDSRTSPELTSTTWIVSPNLTPKDWGWQVKVWDIAGNESSFGANGVADSWGHFSAIKRPSWMLMYYMANGSGCGNNLDSDIVAKFSSIASNITNDVQAFILVDRSSGAGLDRVFRLKRDGDMTHYADGRDRWTPSQIGLSDPEFNTGSIDTINAFTDFVLGGTWKAVDVTGADHYAMSIFDHGGGISPKVAEETTVGSGIKGIACDDYPIYFLSVSDLGDAATHVKTLLGRNLEVLHLDACLMQMVEVNYQLKDSVDYLVASENIGWASSPSSYEGTYIYGMVPTTDANTLAQSMANAYFNHFQNDGRTISVTRPGQVAAISSAIDSLASTLITNITSIHPDIQTAQAHAQKFAQEDATWTMNPFNYFLDLRDFCEEIIQHVTVAAVQTAANSVITAIGNPGGSFLVLERHANGYNRDISPDLPTPNSGFWFDKGTHGLSIFFPNEDTSWTYENYTNQGLSPANLAFTASTRWDEFLRIYHDDSTPIVIIASPTDFSFYNSTVTPITLLGSASDNVGVTSVSWSNNRGGSGTCSGTTTWICSGIALLSGQNILIVRASDARGNQGSDYLVVTYVVPCYSLSISASPSAGGNVTVNTSQNCSGGYTSGTGILLSAQASPNYIFSGWTGTGGSFSDPSLASTTFTITANASVTANFTYVPSCASWSLSPPSANPTAAAGWQDVTITGSPANCTGTWSAVSNDPSWLSVSQNSGGNGSSTRVSWSANNGAARSGSASIGGINFPVDQASGIHTLTITAGPSGSPNPVASGGTVNLILSASDSLGHILNYDWSASCGWSGINGDFSDPHQQNPTWTAPINLTGNQQFCTIQVSVSDGQGLSQTKPYDQNVYSSAHAIIITTPPSGNPNPVASGGTVNLSVSAMDTLLHQLVYVWSASCPWAGSNGSFSDIYEPNPTWTAPANTTGNLQKCTIQATVGDGQLPSYPSASYDQTVNPEFPGSFSKINPTNGAPAQPTSLTLTWGGSSGATSYEYCYDTTDNNSCDGTWTNVDNSTSTGINVAIGTTYYWQVQARNAAGPTPADGGSWWSFIAGPQIPQQERDALIALYNSTNGPSWTDATGWLGPVGTECSWYGVTCDTGKTSVTHLLLGSNQLSGSIPSSLGNLTNLRYLFLDSNQLGGSIPSSLGNLTNLQYLFLDSNQLSGSIPPELGNLLNLQVLLLYSNQLSGSIPSSLGNLANLQHLYLYSNQLSGSIPPELGNLANLQILYLFSNQLSGSIPTSIGNLAKLQSLFLNSNQLSGSIPSSLGNLANLQSLLLNSNQLSGSIPSELGNMTSLYLLNLGSNQLSGSIPSSLGNLANLQRLYLDSNQLSGSIPPELGNLTNPQDLVLSSNKLSGNIPTQLTNLVHLTYHLDISWNALYATDGNLVSLLDLKQPGWQTTQTIAPAGVFAAAQSSSSILASWTPIAYTADVGRYQVYWSTTSGGPYNTLGGSTSNKSESSLLLTGLNPSTTYYVVVRTVTDPHAINQNTVTSEDSSEVSATTPAVQTVAITVTTSPSGRSFTVDGTPYTSQQTFSWIPGSSHTLSTTTLQSGVTGTQYVWNSWSNGEAISHTIVAPASATTYTANFTTQYLLTTIASPTSGGTISASPTSASGFYDSGTSVELTAAANSGYVFSNWSGDLTGSANPRSVTMSAPRSVTANFAPCVGITIATNPVGLGFSVDGAIYTTSQTFTWVVGSSHTLATTSPQGTGGTRHVFTNWSDGGAMGHTVTAPATATSYTASFKIQFVLTTATSPASGGTVSANPASIDGFYDSSTSVELTATANGGYIFSNWSGDLTGFANPQSITMSALRNVTANFSSTSRITITTDPVGLGFSVDGAIYTTTQTFTWIVGSSHMIATASPQGAGGTVYAFANWSDGEAISHTIVAPASATIYTANFTTQYLLTIVSSPTSGGTISTNPLSANGFYNSGTSVELTAIPNGGYTFGGWSGAGFGSCTGTNNPATITMNSPITETASFSSSGSSVNIALSAGGAEVAATGGNSITTQAGYSSLAVNSGADPYGTAVFSFVQQGVTVNEAGVPASPPTTLARIFIDWRSSVLAVPAQGNSGIVNINTGIAVVNTGSTTANVTYTLRDAAGSILTAGNGTIAAGAHFAKFIDQLTDVAPNFSLPSNFQTDIQFASLEIDGDQPLSVLALRGTNNQRNDFLITTTPVADLTKPVGNNPIYFPQFVDGGGYTTSLVLLNTSSAVENGTLEILDDNGLPLSVRPVGGLAGSSFRYSIPANGSFRLQTDGFPVDFSKGWVRLTPDPGTATPTGSGIFAYNPVNMLLSESGIPSAVSTTHARIFADLSGSHNTGLAIANIASTNASIALNAFQMDGVTPIGTGQGPLPLTAYGHDAKFADQFITGLPTGFTGVLDISSTTPFAALTIRSLLNERHDFLMTTFPIADANAQAPSPIVFPQVVDGGGYVTQFIFISPTAASTSILSFWDDTGAPLAIGQ
jgi:Leucine-rich repeat (LRR) protein